MTISLLMLCRLKILIRIWCCSQSFKIAFYFKVFVLMLLYCGGMAGKTKYFAVRKGHQRGIFHQSWKEVEPLVKGFSGAEFKSFASRAQAEAFMNQGGSKEGNNGVGRKRTTFLNGEETNPFPSSSSSSLGEQAKKPKLDDALNVHDEALLPKCLCKRAAVKRTVSKENANKGRDFYSCASNACKYFSFADGRRSLSTTSSSSSSSLNGISPETVIIYTDGSCKGNSNVAQRQPPAGWGWVAITNGNGLDDEEGEVIAEQCGPVIISSTEKTEEDHYLGAKVRSNNTAELSAIGFALKFILDQHKSPASSTSSSSSSTKKHYVIRYDSEYACKSILGEFNGEKNTEIIRFIRAKLRAVQLLPDVSLGWSKVKGHSNNKWNDRADELAAMGARKCASK